MKSANQLRKLKRRKHQAVMTIIALETLLDSIKSISSNPKEVDTELAKLSIFINKHTSDKDNSSFQSLNAWSKYAEFIKKDRYAKVDKQIKKSKTNNLNWQDFEELILHLKMQKLSNENIAKEIEKRGAKCNRESIRLFLKKHNEE